MVARRLQAGAPQTAARLDWETLEAAPAWLALPEADLATLVLRAGALQHAPLMRMWIDAPRLAAANAVLGEEFLPALLTLPEAQMPLAKDALPQPEIDAAEQVVPALRTAGQGVLLAALPRGHLRDALAECWSPAEPCAMAEELAGMLLARMQWLASRLQAQDEATASNASVSPAGPAPLADSAFSPERAGVAA